MSKYAGEEVLVVRRALLEEIGMFQGIQTNGLDVALGKLLDPANHFSWIVQRLRMILATNS